MKKYSFVHTVEGKDFRYNYTDGLLEFIYFDIASNKIEIIDMIGLSEHSWENDREGYMLVYSNDLDYELNALMETAKDEFGL